MAFRCSKCKREIEKFSEKYVQFGVVERKDECKDCDLVDGSNLVLCLECADEKEPK